jgi:hypothetical protein
MSRDSELPEYVFGPKQAYLRKMIEPVLKSPVYHERWDAMRQSFVAAVQERADGLDLSFDAAVREVALGAISVAVSSEEPRLPLIRFEGKSTELAPDSVAAWGRVFNYLVNQHATEALLGADWREPPAVPTPPLPKDEFSLALQLDYFLASGRLTASETRIVTALQHTVLGGGDVHEAAAQLHMRYDALKKALQRIRTKAS